MVHGSEVRTQKVGTARDPQAYLVLLAELFPFESLDAATALFPFSGLDWQAASIELYPRPSSFFLESLSTTMIILQAL